MHGLSSPDVHDLQEIFATLSAVEHRGDLIRVARETAGLSQAELAEELSISPSYMSRLEKGGSFIEPPLFQKLISALRTISPIALIEANGYPITTRRAVTLPPALVQDLLEMTPDELDALALLVHRRGHQGPPPTVNGRR